ncbi:MAG: hypothetical protein JW913_08495 [Chitinispirillaceae bacterium]|nr:hypothetical protein [Chitinispirillaceae bacterium]
MSIVLRRNFRNQHPFNRLHRIIRIVFILPALARLCPANPLPPIPVITEIQAIDPLHWSIEMDITPMGLPTSSPGTTDSITLYCAAPKMNDVHDDSLKTCVQPVEYTDQGLALLTEKHFPGQELEKGSVIHFGVSGTSMRDCLEITEDFSPQTSIIRTFERKCCEYFYTDTAAVCRSYCDAPVYRISTCPSPGFPNYDVLGSIGGKVLGGNGDALAKINIYCTSSESGRKRASAATNADGAFSLRVDTCGAYLLRFYDAGGESISDTVIGPLQFSNTNLISLEEVKLGYVPTSVSSGRRGLPGSSSSSIRIFPSYDTRGRSIVLTISGNTPAAAKGVCEIISLDGAMVRSLPFAFSGPGTYAIAWDGTGAMSGSTAPATYICRVRIGRELWCKGFIIQ